MKSSKLIAIGFLICLVALFLFNGTWAYTEAFAFFPWLALWLFPAGVIIAIVGIFKSP